MLNRKLEMSNVMERAFRGKDNIIRSRTEPIATTDFGQRLFEGLRRNPEAVIINDVQLGVGATSREILEKSETLAQHLLRFGCVKGDVIAVFSPNSIEYLVVAAAAFRIGAVPAPINSLLQAGELQHNLKICKPKFVYTVQSLVPVAKEAINRSNVKTILVAKDGGEDCVRFESVLKKTKDLPPLQDLKDLGMKPTDPGLILFSSGTTGLSKAVLISHHNLQATFTLHSQPEGGFLFDGQLHFAPFAHAVGAFALLYGTCRGYTTNFLSRFEFEKYLQFIEKQRLDVLYVLPPLATRLAKSPEVSNFDLNCVKWILSTSAPFGKKVEEKLKERFPGVTVGQGYGMTEATGYTHFIPVGEATASVARQQRPGTIGRLICNTEVKVISVENGATLGPHLAGEMCIRSPGVMVGYLHNPQATALAIDKDGWLHTGDLTYYDEDEYFFIVGRLKELIKYNGYQVPPAELDSILLTHPAVADAGVFGIPDVSAGELPTAWVVKSPGSNVTEAELVKFVAEQVAPFKRLRGGVRFVSSIPKTISGKILRREMAAATVKGKL